MMTTNGHDQFRAFQRNAPLMALNVSYSPIMSRGMQRAGNSPDERRNLEHEAGYPDIDTTIDISLYQNLYERDSIAARVVEVWPRESWKVQPSIYEDDNPEVITPFEQSWKDLPMYLGDRTWRKEEKGSVIFEYLKRADELSGIGRFGVLLLGYDDGADLTRPVKGVLEKNSMPVRAKVTKSDSGALPAPEPSLNRRLRPYSLTNNQLYGKTGKLKLPKRLIYLRPFSEAHVEILEVEGNISSPRYGRPTRYSIQLNDPRETLPYSRDVQQTAEVHWTRVIHLADTHHTASSSDVLAVPRMRAVLNNLLGLRKLYIGSPEMFWSAAYPGISLELLPGIDPKTPVNLQEIKDELEEYFNSLKRYLVPKGFHVSQLSPAVADPASQIEVQLQAIGVKLTIPLRILIGSEMGELSSAQDSTTWSGRVGERQNSYNTPRVVGPFVDRNIMVGALEEPSEWYCWWPDITSLSELEKAQVSSARISTMAAYAQSGLNMTLMPEKDFLTKEMDYTDDEAQSMLDNASVAKEEAMAEEQLQQEEQMLQQEEMVKRNLAPDPLDPAQQKLAAGQEKAFGKRGKGGNPFAGGQKGKAKPRIPGKGRMENKV